MSQITQREFSAAQILEWSRSDTPIVAVKTGRDAFPGGLAVAMAPVLVDWAASSIGFGREDFYLLQNVNLSSNPVGGSTLLGTVRVPADGVERVEFVVVLSKVGKVETEAGHAQLRFVFKKDRGLVIFTGDGRPLANEPDLSDLVLSWEAWRPPAADFDPVAGLDPDKYALTLRCFDGPSRCLSDAALDRPWVCYPLKLPDIPHAADEVLYVSLLLGDAVARQTIGAVLDRAIGESGGVPDDYSDPEARDWAEIKQLIERQSLPEDPIRAVLDGQVGYHLLLRSCITMALMSIDWAHLRMSERAGRPAPKRIRTTPDALPGLLDSLVRGERTHTLLKIPAAVHWLMNHHSVIPGKAYKLLDEAGLLWREDGKVVSTHFDNRRESPYGRIQDHLMF